MDAALLLIAANETCPQPQTSEHLAAIEIMKLKHILVLQVRLPFLSLSSASLPFFPQSINLLVSDYSKFRTKSI